MTTHTTTRPWILLAAALLAGCACAASGPVSIGLVYTTDKCRELSEDGTDRNATYRNAVEACGATVVELRQPESRETVRARLPGLHGLLLPGGIDVDPKAYGETPHPKLEKVDADLDALEFEAIEYAKNHELPVLGICRGHQVINVYYGGSLYQDIPGQFIGETKVTHRFPKDSSEPKVHDISIQRKSLLYELLQVERITVNTYHHQAVKALAPGFIVAARSEDGIVEAIERTDGAFVLGVQFHPEKMLQEDPRMKAIFQRFVEEARQFAQTSPSIGAQP